MICTIRRKYEKGESRWKLAYGAVKRGVQLTFFAIFIQHFVAGIEIELRIVGIVRTKHHDYCHTVSGQLDGSVPHGFLGLVNLSVDNV